MVAVDNVSGILVMLHIEDQQKLFLMLADGGVAKLHEALPNCKVER
jgi:hypothetical protein